MLLARVLATLLCSPAVAGDTVIALVGVHQADMGRTPQETAMRDVAAALAEKRPGVKTIWGPDFADAIKGREQAILEDGFLEPGKKLLEQGRAFYIQAQPEDAIPVLEEAIEALRRGIPAANKTNDLWEAHMMLGTAHYQLDDEKASHEAWGAAVALNPVRNPNAVQYPPDVVEGYQVVRGALSEYRAIVTIQTSEEDARVWLNGRERGLAPIVLDDVLPGENHLFARDIAGEVDVRALNVDAGGEITIKLKMRDPKLGIPATSGLAKGKQVGGLYRAIARHAAADLVLIAGTHDGVLAMQFYDRRTDTFSRTTEVPINGTSEDEAVAAVPLLLGVLDETDHVRADMTATYAAPIDVSSNSHLARLLFKPGAGGSTVIPVEVEVDPEEEKRLAKEQRKKERQERREESGVNWVVVGVASVAGAGLVGAGAYLFTQTGPDEPPEQVQDGTIVVDPAE